MKLNAPYMGMPHIWNISADVGVTGDCMNARDDVELIQHLIIERYKVIPSKVARAPGIAMLMSASGRMDTQTAFEVYWAGAETKPLRDAERISPARSGSVSYGSGMWSIAYLNAKLYKHAPQVWANLPALCTLTLKNALLTKTTP
ncbi:MAG: hypothetical protein WAM94_08145 [Chromatiaceae bacterium]